MPTSRADSAAVHIPQLGELVLGGWGVSRSPVATAELLCINDKGESNTPTWIKIDPMLRTRGYPSAVLYNDYIYVASWDEFSVERLSLLSGRPGQWTLISCSLSSGWYPRSLCVFKGKIVASGKLKHGH